MRNHTDYQLFFANHEEIYVKNENELNPVKKAILDGAKAHFWSSDAVILDPNDSTPININTNGTPKS